MNTDDAKTGDLASSACGATQIASQSPRTDARSGTLRHFNPGDVISGYALIRKLGEGNFGIVYLARDLTLGRNVAIKIARADVFQTPEDIADFHAEARNAARISHPGVVTVHSVALEHDPPFIVEEYVEGKDLKAVLEQGTLPLVNVVRLVASLAETIAYAHQLGIYHRDLKPANILITPDGRARIVDFGLALQEGERRPRDWERCGTPLYMAPEQVRGESHRVDGRCDIWSLGAILYELLLGRRPFQGPTREELYEQILEKDARPPRQLKPELPHELERICLKCLAKRMSDRYSTAADLAADLRALLSDWDADTAADQPPLCTPVTTGPWPRLAGVEGRAKIVPKGLRAFDEHDADFFLDLTPGPRDRQGLPEAIRFWKHRIEEASDRPTFAVGVIYGPSGCGKSSLVRAGLLPRLSERVIPIYIEARQDETLTMRLLNQLYQRFPSLPTGLELHEAIAELRVGRVLTGQSKVLLVLDQFEQWLHGAPADNDLFVQALRQCDGRRVQGLLLVRDDFWLAVSRLMRQLELPVLEGVNSALVDLFDPDHAANVLEAFGRAYNRLPDDPEQISTEQRAFVDQAIAALAEDGKLNCVRLALFAEMMKGKPWTPANLKRMGGVEGIGVAFLEDRFSAVTAPPRCRVHQQAVRSVLTRLLPDPGAKIRGHRRTQSDLLQASGYTSEQDFAELLQILDAETRLITPGDAMVATPAAAGEGGQRGEKIYQLTHDYLVPSLREWLTQRKRETRRGRAELRLAERADLWNARRERNQLPSAWETVGIACLTTKRDWTTAQRRMMKAAIRLHVRRLGVTMLAVCIVGAAGLVAWRQTLEIDRRQQADHFVTQVLVSELERFPSLLDQAPAEQTLWRSRLRTIADDPQRDEAERTRAHLVLARSDPAGIPYLMEGLRKADLRSALQIQAALGRWPKETLPPAWTAISDPGCSDAELLRLGSFLAQHDGSSGRWKEVAQKVAAALVKADQLEAGPWMTALQPANRWLIDPLAAHLRDDTETSSRRTMAAEILANFGRDSPEKLSAWLLEAGPEQFPAIYTVLERHRPSAVPFLTRQLASTPAASAFEAIEKQMRAAVALLRLGHADPVWPLLRQSAEPGLRTAMIWAMNRYGVPAELLVRELEHEHPASVRSALLLALGNYDFDRSRRPYADAAEAAAALYEHDPDRGVHSAAQWLLKTWDIALPELSTGLPPAKSEKEWWVNSQGHTMIAQHGPVEFIMGSPPTEPGRDPIEDQHPEVINRSFAISAHEVTIEQCLAFDPEFQFARDVGPEPQCPANRISWFLALRYCRWLSEQEGIPEDQMCYPPLDQIGPVDVELSDDLLARTGYRLPTEAEWEFMCRAGSETPWFFGADPSFLREYCWYTLNTAERTYPVGTQRPNPFGLFDTYGNIEEWCQDFTGLPTTNEQVSKLAQGIDVRAGERILKGGYHRAMVRWLRSAKRQSFPPTAVFSHLGFRIARTLP